MTIRSEDAAEQQDAHLEWRRARAASVTSAQGNLALVETRWLPVESTLTREDAARDLPPGVTVTDVSRRNIHDGSSERGLRFWDAQSPAIRSFESILTFDHDPEWVITGTFTPVGDGRLIPFEHLRDNGLTRDLPVPGDIAVAIAGQEFTLSAFDDDGQLLLVFADATNGNPDPELSAYGNGRFLFVTKQAPPGVDASVEAQHVTLDFNRAFIPPCGFSYQYNCPLPPLQNRLPFAVTAGERLIVSRGEAH